MRGQPRRLDEAEPAVAAAVDHRRATGLGVREQEEVVAEQLHLERGLLDVHRLHAELLGLHERPRRVLGAVVVDRRRRRRSSAGSAAPAAAGRARASRSRAVPAADPPLVQPAHLLLDLVERPVERDRVLGRRRGALHEVLAHVHEDLARVRVLGSARRVMLVVDVDPAHVVRELVDPLDLLDRERAQRGIDFAVLADHDDVHRHSRDRPLADRVRRRAGEYRQRRRARSPGPRRARDRGGQHVGARRARAARAPRRPASRPSSRRRRRRAPRDPRSRPCRAASGPARRSATAARPVCGGPSSRTSSRSGADAELARDRTREQRAVVDAARGAPASRSPEST